MEELRIEKINGLKKIYGIEALLTISLASFSVSTVIIFVMSFFAVTTINLDEIWLIVLEFSFITAGILLLIVTIISVVKEPARKKISLLLIVIPLTSAALPLIPLQLNFTNFKDHFYLAETYPHFKNLMWKETSYLLASSILIIFTIISLIVIKINQKEVKKNIPLLVTSALSLLVILPLQIIGLAVSKFDNSYEIGIKLFWGAMMGFAIISIPIFYYITKEIEVNTKEKIIRENQIEKDEQESIIRRINLLLENNSKIMIIFGAVCIITSMMWLIFKVTNQHLTYFFYRNLPDAAFPQFALYGLGTIIIAYNLLKWYRIQKQQLIPIVMTIIALVVIIPVKIFSIYIIWKWGAENIIYTTFGWTSKLKPFTIILTDLIPIAISLLCASIAIWRINNKKRKNSWLFIIPSFTLMATIIFLSIVCWLLWGDSSFNFDNFYRLFAISCIITMIEISYLITLMLFELEIKKLNSTKTV